MDVFVLVLSQSCKYDLVRHCSCPMKSYLRSEMMTGEIKHLRLSIVIVDTTAAPALYIIFLLLGVAL